MQSHPFEQLDEFALLACQDYNLGNTSDWFGSFRGGLYGFYGRVFGIGEHYRLLHEWLPPRLHWPEDTEYHLSSVFFNMDSAVECLTFAFNALGFAAYPDGFRDVSRPNTLRNISPLNILGKNVSSPSREPPLCGYVKVYPSMQSHFDKNYDFLSSIFDLHDVSKHREALYTGGQVRSDAPPGFYEALDLEENHPSRFLFGPHETILLKPEPKTPRSKRPSIPRDKHCTLELIVPQFLEFLQKSCELALNDVQTNITLKHPKFPPAHKPFPFNHVSDGVWE
jgi:hypothetical protein